MVKNVSSSSKSRRTSNGGKDATLLQKENRQVVETKRRGSYRKKQGKRGGEVLSDRTNKCSRRSDSSVSDSEGDNTGSNRTRSGIAEPAQEVAGELLEFDFSESELIDDQEEEKVDEADSDPGWIAARNERDMRAKRDKERREEVARLQEEAKQRHIKYWQEVKRAREAAANAKKAAARAAAKEKERWIRQRMQAEREKRERERDTFDLDIIRSNKKLMDLMDASVYDD